MPADAPHFHAPRPGLAQRALLRGIRTYQVLLSPMYAGSCRYLPSCSAYASEAVARYGATRGSWLALRRLMRCHPFGGHGFDPVPGNAPGHPRAPHFTSSDPNTD